MYINLVLFVIMLVRVRTIPQEPQYLRGLVPAAIGLGALLAVLVGVGVWAAVQGAPADGAVLQNVQGVNLGNTEAVGWNLYRDYLLPFEVVSIVLLVAMIVAIAGGYAGWVLMPQGIEVSCCGGAKAAAEAVASIKLHGKK